ncbi:MAG: hypothetical protein JWM26_4656, partial [Betaproteobacteria bacterium]|nr:hypothetical protein [Betaproteobacteria bacterium]
MQLNLRVLACALVLIAAPAAARVTAVTIT